MEAGPHRGQCACGAVRYEVNGVLRPVMNCHCHRCRRVTGHFMAATSADLDQLTVHPSNTLRWYEAAAGVFYGFCSECGSTLFWRNEEEPHRWSIAAGTLDPPTGLETIVSIWTAEASDYHGPIVGPQRRSD